MSGANFERQTLQEFLAAGGSIRKIGAESDVEPALKIAPKFRMTAEWLRQHASTPSGGWTAQQLAHLGLPYPPKSGWLKKAHGRWIEEWQRDAFERCGTARREKIERRRQGNPLPATQLAPAPNLRRLAVYTDGACLTNPGGAGGWAALVLREGNRALLRGSSPSTTSNRMELTAALEALRSLLVPTAVRLHSDSRYLVDGMSSWVRGWKRNGWTTKKNEPVKNADLWYALDEQNQKHDVEWCWVKGHAGQAENEECDRHACAMALQAANASR